MKITLLMIATYIVNCIRIGTYPYKVFQLNSKYFDLQKGIFSKIDTDNNIPEQWRLPQRYDDDFVPEIWPVFVKPEWGSNANGVQRADNLEQLNEIRSKRTDETIRYLIQDGSPSHKEFEVFSIRHDQDRDQAAIFTITEAVNDDELKPVNSIYNNSTRYVEVTGQLSEQQLAQLWQHVNRLGEYNISRASLSADSLEALLKGQFYVIEINLFLPMPINLLDQKYSAKDIFNCVRQYMMCLAKVTKYRDRSLPDKPIFPKTMLYNRNSSWARFINSKF